MCVNIVEAQVRIFFLIYIYEYSGGTYICSRMSDRSHRHLYCAAKFSSCFNTGSCIIFYKYMFGV